MKTKEDYLKEIGEMFISSKKKGLSRFDMEWGSWSVKMNTELRERIEKGDPKNKETTALKYILIYWTLKSQILELYFKSKILGRGKIKRLAKEAKKIKGMILEEGYLKPIKYEDVAKGLLNL